jgi:hypothetical protein
MITEKVRRLSMRKMLCVLLAMVMAFGLFGCGSKKSEPDPKPAEEPVAQITPNPLTGEALADPATVNNRPVAVMLNNLYQALPQAGNSEADIIYEFIVEGGITRLCAIYQDVSDVKEIGPVRSARQCFLETAMGLDAIYAHAGGSSEADANIAAWGVDDLDGCGAEGDYFWRDQDRWNRAGMEHSLMTSGENLMNYISSSGIRTTHEAGYTYPLTFTEDGTPVNGTAATKVTVQFSSYKTNVFTYDSVSKLYMIEGFDEPYIDATTNQQVGVTNVLVLKTSVVNSGDASGHMNVDLTGSGEGTYFCGGQATDIIWTKNDTDEPFSYTLADGSAFSMGIGKTYVCMISDTSSDMTIG